MQSALNSTTESGKKLFYASYFLMLVHFMLAASTLSVYLDMDGVFFKYVWRIAAWLPILIKLSTQDRFSVETFKRYLVFGLVCIVGLIFNRNFILADIAILVIGIHGVNLKSAVRIFFYTSSAICAMLFVLSLCGVIENYQNDTAGIPRYAFGNVYPTDFAATLFYIELAHGFIKGKKYGPADFLFWTAAAAFVLIFCVARLDSVLMFAFALAMMLATRNPRLFNDKAVSGVLVISVPVLCVIALLMHVFYSPQNPVLGWINGIFSGRLEFGKAVIQDYGFSLFGHNIKMQGWGFKTSEWDESLGYYFVDSGWLSVTLRFGFVMTIFMCASFMAASKKYIREKNYVLPIVILFISITSIVDHHVLEVGYNPFLFVFNVLLCAEKSGKRSAVKLRSAAAKGK